MFRSPAEGVTYDTARVCKQVADYIERVGWIQHSYRTDKGVCLFTALSDCHSHYGAVHTVIRAELTGGMPISDWNDQPGRTKEEVIDGLKRIAEQIF